MDQRAELRRSRNEGGESLGIDEHARRSRGQLGGLKIEQRPPIENVMTPADGPRDDPSSAWREDAVRATARAIRRCLESASYEAIFEVDAKERVVTEEGWERAFGLDAPEPSRLDLFEARIHPAHRPRWREAWAEHRTSELPLEISISLAHVDRGWRRHQCRAASRRDLDGHARRTFLVCRDVSELLELQELSSGQALRIETLETELAAARRGPPRPPAPKRLASRPLRPPGGALAAARGRLVAIGQAISEAKALLSRPRFDGEGVRQKLDAAGRALEAAQERRDSEDRSPRAFSHVKTLHEDLSLTALNAQLEALRLGAQGAGLAAVAGQMKQLARSTTASTEIFEETMRELRSRDEQQRRALERVSVALIEAKAMASAVQEPPGEAARLRAALAEAENLARVTDGDHE